MITLIGITILGFGFSLDWHPSEEEDTFYGWIPFNLHYGISFWLWRFELSAWTHITRASSSIG